MTRPGVRVKKSPFERASVRAKTERQGLLEVYLQRDGTFDLSVVAPEGPSAAIYMTHWELLAFAEEVLARYAMESGMEIGEQVERLRSE